MTGVSCWGELLLNICLNMHAWVVVFLDVWSDSKSELHPSRLDDITYRVVFATQNSDRAAN